MSMNKFFICRHCKSVLDGKDMERDLDEDGKKQSKSLSNKIAKLIDDNTIIYSSPFIRAVNSLEPLKAGLPNINLIQEDGLKEINLGKSDKLSKHQIIENMWLDGNFKVDNGESQLECFERIKPFLVQAFEKYNKNKKNIIFVTHGNLIGIILKYFFHLKFDFNDWKSISMPDFYKIVFDENMKALSYERDVENIDNLFYVK